MLMLVEDDSRNGASLSPFIVLSLHEFDFIFGWRVDGSTAEGYWILYDLA